MGAQNAKILDIMNVPMSRTPFAEPIDCVTEWLQEIDKEKLDQRESSAIKFYLEASYGLRKQICAQIWADLGADPHRYDNTRRLIQFVRGAVTDERIELYRTNNIKYELCLDEVVVERCRFPKWSDKECTILNDCTICQNSCEDPPGKFDFVTLECGHNFHHKCMWQWIEEKFASALCPLCKQKVRSWLRRDTDPLNGVYLCDIALLAVPVQWVIIRPADILGDFEDVDIDSDDVAIDPNESEDYVEDTQTHHRPALQPRLVDDVRYYDDDSDESELDSIEARQRARENRIAMRRLFR